MMNMRAWGGKGKGKQVRQRVKSSIFSGGAVGRYEYI